MTTHEILQRAKAACPEIALASSEKKIYALSEMANALIENTDKILSANEEDVKKARGVVSDVMIDRLILTESRIRSTARFC